MIRNPIDVATRVSQELSLFIEGLNENPELEQPLTLSAARDYLAWHLPSEIRETESLHHIDDADSLLDELDVLIEEFGEDAAAMDFAEVNASEPLTRVIEAVLNDENRENPPTLAAVREAMAAGVMERLVGEGALEEDEDDNLMAEIDDLIGRYGPDAPAESLLRYE
jgi:hypothetical protein